MFLILQIFKDYILFMSFYFSFCQTYLLCIPVCNGMHLVLSYDCGDQSMIQMSIIIVIMWIIIIHGPFIVQCSFMLHDVNRIYEDCDLKKAD